MSQLTSQHTPNSPCRPRRGRRTALLGLAGCAIVGTIAAPYALADVVGDRTHEDAPVQLSQRGRRGGGGGMRWLQQIDLSDEQTNAIQAIRDRYQPQMASQREAMQAQRRTLHELMGSNATEADIRQARSQMMELRDDMSDLHFDSMMEIRNVLTPEQRAQVADLMEQRWERHRERGEGMRDGRRQGGRSR